MTTTATARPGTSKRRGTLNRIERNVSATAGTADRAAGRRLPWARPVAEVMDEPIEYVPGDWAQLPRRFVPVAERPQLGRMTAREERETFLWMNFLRYRAETVRRMILADPQSNVTPAVVERLLAEATAVRNYLVTVFSRLAASLAHAQATAENRWDELLSEAQLTLLRTVELFDVRRGYRFSTYATNAVRHNLNRYVMRQHKLRHSTRDFLSHDEVVAESFACPRRMEQQYRERMQSLAQWVEQLDPREQQIVRSRYALGARGIARTVTLQVLAQQLGVSRERVRQLERRALDKLRALARFQATES